MTRPAYTLYPGTVFSSTDGQKHFVGRNELARLYNVPLNLCLTIYDSDFSRPDLRDHVAFAATLTALRPRYDGNYRLPAPAQSDPKSVSPPG